MFSLWSPLSGLKGVKPPLVFGGRTRDCSPGNAGPGSSESVQDMDPNDPRAPPPQVPGAQRTPPPEAFSLASPFLGGLLIANIPRTSFPDSLKTVKS